MATRRKTTTRRRATVAAAPQKRAYRRRTGYDRIPNAGLVAGIAVSNLGPIQTVATNLSADGAKNAIAQMVTKDQLVRTGIGAGAGYLAGYAVQKFAPRFIKKPIAAIAKKLPKVI